MANDLEAVIDEARQQASEELQDCLSPLSIGLAGLIGACSKNHQLIADLTADEAPVQAEFLRFAAQRVRDGMALLRTHARFRKALIDLCHFTACVATDIADRIAPGDQAQQQAVPPPNPEEK